MKRIWGHLVSLLGLALVGSAAFPACATNDQSIFIRGALAPSTNRQNNVCIYTDDPSQAELFEGSVDLGIRDDYFGILLIGNQMTPRADNLNNRAESNRIHIDGAVVQVTNPDGSLIREFTSTATGFADPSSNSAPDYGTIGVTLIDAPTKAALLPLLPNRTASKMVVAKVKAFGRTLGGLDLESGEFQFPISVCNGCLVDFSTGTDPAQPLPNCRKALDAAAGGTALPCFVGQDERTPCQLCQGRPVCDPATP
ncbi:hypothetical protein AKJ09_03433 [Labilithrix luteola]|uniref:Lipoprotein n=1 Tax=Labilithrix luteola TaxID=1391654 RepID=A0A0K1PUH7_9BACT|nr:hypothetical protein [Labilithrix luteola]AKU96769.1 hypothetical protein AKJ09_03433 [Labilithrix luteola]